MPRNFDLKTLLGGMYNSRDPRVSIRLVLGILLLANIIAAWATVKPVGGSAEELDAQVATLRVQIQQKQAVLKRTQSIFAKMESARNAGDNFMGHYFMTRKTASSTILSELMTSAKESGMKPKGDAFTFEPVEGSDTLSMMTIAANYEGTYGDLLQFMNRLDKSQRFLILENLTAAPQQGSGLLNTAIKLNTFVREEPLQQ